MQVFVPLFRKFTWLFLFSYSYSYSFTLILNCFNLFQLLDCLFVYFYIYFILFYQKECTFISELTKDYIEEFNFISFKKQFESLEGDSLGTLTKHSKHSKATKHKKKLSDWTKSVQEKVFNFTTSNSTSILDLNHQKDLFQKKIMSTSMTSFLKLTLVGDGGVGKSCLILQYMYGDVS